MGMGRLQPQPKPRPPTWARLRWKKNCTAALRHVISGLMSPCMAAAVAPISTPARHVLSSFRSAINHL